jgi:hypothetical protein
MEWTGFFLQNIECTKFYKGFYAGDEHCPCECRITARSMVRVRWPLGGFPDPSEIRPC